MSVAHRTRPNAPRRCELSFELDQLTLGIGRDPVDLGFEAFPGANTHPEDAITSSTGAPLGLGGEPRVEDVGDARGCVP
ncbi:MAG: hypothetical protein ABI435_07590 [Pseudolysinimonas sp.]